MDHLKNVAWIHDGNRKPLFLIGWQVSFKSVHRDKTNKVSTFTVRVLLPITFLWINRMFPWHLTRAAHLTSPTINIHNNLIRGLNSLTDVFLKLVPASGLQSPPPPTHTHLQSINTGVLTCSLNKLRSIDFSLSLSLSILWVFAAPVSQLFSTRSSFLCIFFILHFVRLRTNQVQTASTTVIEKHLRGRVWTLKLPHSLGSHL